MTSTINKERLGKLSDERLNLFCWLVDVKYAHQSGGKDAKLDRLWAALVQRYGSGPDTPLVTVSRAVWLAVTEAPPRERRQSSVDRLRALEAHYGLDPFPLGPKRTVAGTVRDRVKEYEELTPSKGSRRKTGAHSDSELEEDGRSSDNMGDAESTQDVPMDTDEEGNESDAQWQTAGRSKGKRRKKKSARKQRERNAEGQSGGVLSGAEGKSIKDMDTSDSRKQAGEGARPHQQDFMDLQGFGPAAENICRTLRKAMTELRKPVRQCDGATELRLADDMERAVGLMQAFRAGISAERLRSVAQEGIKPPSKKPTEEDGRKTRTGPARTYAEAASAALARPIARVPPFQWDLARTIYLAPKDPDAAKVSIEPYAFGRQLHGLFPPPFNSENLAVERIERSSTNGWKVQFAAEALQYVPGREFTVGDAGTWVPQPVKTPTSASVVVYGIPQNFDDEYVARFLIQGSSHLVRPADRERLGNLRVTRLRTRQRTEQQSTGAGTSAESAPAESSPTRSCRVFLPPDLAQFFANAGEMMLRWKRVRCKPYEPRRFWCQKCRSWGSHSTNYHRQPAVSQDINGPGKGSQS